MCAYDRKVVRTWGGRKPIGFSTGAVAEVPEAEDDKRVEGVAKALRTLQVSNSTGGPIATVLKKEEEATILSASDIAQRVDSFHNFLLDYVSQESPHYQPFQQLPEGSEGSIEICRH